MILLDLLLQIFVYIFRRKEEAKAMAKATKIIRKVPCLDVVIRRGVLWGEGGSLCNGGIP
jgi:hypothetical protein